jgi:hypothetical protein
MTVPTINYIAVILATISSMVVGFVWYTPRVFGNTWMRLTGVVAQGNMSNAARPIIVTVIVSFITAWVLAGAVDISFHFYGGSYLVNSLFTALILWAGFTAARFVTHDQFDRRPWQLTLLNCAHELVTLLVMALIIGVWPA